MRGTSQFCACKSSDARQCFMIRHPECRRTSDCDLRYDSAVDEICECSCHEPDEDDYYDSLVEPFLVKEKQMSEEAVEVIEQEEVSSPSKRKTLSLGERIKVVDYLRSLVEPIVADSNAAVAAIVSDATKVELSWQHLKYMIDDPTMAEWKLGDKVHVRSLLTGDDAIRANYVALEVRFAQLEANLESVANGMAERITALESIIKVGL